MKFINSTEIYIGIIPDNGPEGPKHIETVTKGLETSPYNCTAMVFIQNIIIEVHDGS
jgi:hypothetical protein